MHDLLGRVIGPKFSDLNFLEKFQGLGHKMGVGFLRHHFGGVKSCWEAHQLREITEISSQAEGCCYVFGKWLPREEAGGCVSEQGKLG